MGRAVAIHLSDGIHESRECAFDWRYRILVPQRCIDVPTEVCWHLGAGFADDQYVVLPFQADEVSRLEDHIVARHSQFGLAVIGKIVILSEKKDAADRAGRRLLDLIEYRAAGNEIRLPVQHLSAKAEQIAFDGRGRLLRRAGVAEKHVPPLFEQRHPVVERHAEFIRVKPRNVGVVLEFSDVPAKALVEYDTRKNLALRQNESGQTERMKQRAFVMI